MIKIIRFLTSLLLTLTGIVLVLSFLLPLAIGLLLASLKEVIKYFSRPVEANLEEQVSMDQKQAITIQ